VKKSKDPPLPVNESWPCRPQCVSTAAINGKYSSTLSLTWALDGGGWSRPRPGRFTLGKKILYPSHRRLGGPQGRSAPVRKTSPPPGFDPWIVQHVAIPTELSRPTGVAAATAKLFAVSFAFGGGGGIHTMRCIINWLVWLPVTNNEPVC
jgi:hypothetical protein